MISVFILLIGLTQIFAQIKPVNQSLTDIKLFCSTKAPGAYSQGCGREVILCAADGLGFSLLCPFSTWFDKDSLLCLPANLVSGCSDKKVDEKQNTMANLGLSAQYCSGIRDGYFAVSACSASVIHCSAGEASLFECPVGKAFDALKGGCVLYNEIEDCKKFEKASSSESSESDEVTTSSDSACVDTALLTTDGCSPLYLSCIEGITKIVACPTNLVFDSELKICNWIGDVAACSVKEEKEDAHLCGNADEGLFSYRNCSMTFYSCTDGTQKHLFCPESLAFNGERGVCDYPYNIEECQGEVENDSEESGSGEAMEGSGAVEGSGIEGSGENSGEKIDESGSGSAEEVKEEATAVSEEVLSETSHESDELLTSICSSRGDGFYSTGCSSTLVACKNKEAKRLSCPEPFVWNENMSYCTEKEDIEECNQQEVSTFEQKNSKESSDSEEGNKKLDYEQGDICVHEGTFSSEQCSTQYMLCVSGTAYPLKCDDGYLYSNSDGKCVPASGLSDCFLDIV